MYLLDYVYVTKSVTTSVNKKLKNPCKSLIYRDLQFRDVVPPVIEYIIVSLSSKGKNRLSYYIRDNLILRSPFVL